MSEQDPHFTDKLPQRSEEGSQSAVFVGGLPDDLVETLPFYLRLLFGAAKQFGFAIELLVADTPPPPRVPGKRFVLIGDDVYPEKSASGPLAFDMERLLPDIRAAKKVVIVSAEPVVSAFATAIAPLVKDDATVAVLVETDDRMERVWIDTIRAARGASTDIVVHSVEAGDPHPQGIDAPLPLASLA